MLKDGPEGKEIAMKYRKSETRRPARRDLFAALTES
jgi:hypothetical protein